MPDEELRAPLAPATSRTKRASRAGVLRLGTGEVGRRVLVRHSVAGDPDDPAAPPWSDLLGTLESYSDTTVRVRRADGTAIELATASVAAGKAIPPPPTRRRR